MNNSNNDWAKKIRNDFPVILNNNIVYFDNGATAQKPKQVIDRIIKFYQEEYGTIHRGVYDLSANSTELYDDAHAILAKFINATEEEIIFTKGTTESLNLLATCIFDILPKDKNEIVLTDMEHHANLVPWQQFAKRHNFTIKFIPLTKDYELDVDKVKELITDKTAIVSFTALSNVLGTKVDSKKLIEIAKSHGALTIVDAAQAIAHEKIDVKELDCDFLAFSAHKMYGPTGIGVLYGKNELLTKLPPYQFGGDMIESVTYETATWNELPFKFEAGTPNIVGAIGFAECINYINKIGFQKISEWETELRNYAFDKLSELDFIKIIGTKKGLSLISFTMDGVHPHDIATLLNDYKICVRAGHHCAMPLIKKLGLSATIRISFSMFNTFEDVDKLIVALKEIKNVFK